MTETQMRLAGGTLSLASIVLVVATLLTGFLPALSIEADLAPLDRWAIAVLALALYVAGYSLRREAPAFALLAFVFLTGGGAQLYMTEPLWFQTLRLTPERWREWLMVGLMAFEGLVAALVLTRPAARELLSRSVDKLGIGRIILFALLSFAFAVPVISYIGRGAFAAYLAHVAAGAVLISLHGVVLVAMAVVKSPVSGLHRISPVVPAAFTVVASLALSFFAFERMPHVQDEVAYLFQARTFAGGALTAPAPPEAALAGLDYYLLDIKDGRWFAATLPGWPAALSLGVLVGLQWLINPILAGLSVLLAYDITRRKAGGEQADLVALTMACSPWLLAAAASYMPHTFTLFLLLVSWWMILRSNPHGPHELRRLLVAGLAMGWIFAARPLDGVVLGGLTGLWVLAGPHGTKRRAVPYVIGCALIGGLLLIYNHAITGSMFSLPLTDYLDRLWQPGANAYGFGREIGPPEGWGALDLWRGHSPLEAVINVVNLLVSLQFELLGWSVGSLALVFAFLLWQRPRAFDGVMLIVIAAVMLSVGLYWFADSYYLGPRYWFPAAFAFFFLGARGYEALRTRFPGADGRGFTRIDAIIGVCCFFGLTVFTPWHGVVKYHEYGGFHATFVQAARAGDFGNDVVVYDTAGDIGSAMVLNDPWLAGSDGPIFVLRTPDTDLEAIGAAFPDRNVVAYATDWESRKP